MNEKLSLQDVLLRVLIVLAGGLAATLLALKGQAAAIPALALGAMLGTFVMARIGPTEE